MVRSLSNETRQKVIRSVTAIAWERAQNIACQALVSPNLTMTLDRPCSQHLMFALGSCWRMSGMVGKSEDLVLPKDKKTRISYSIHPGVNNVSDVVHQVMNEKINCDEQDFFTRNA
uniref:Uncharacterized protein n=1 Tax=Compsopogon caeruleus TaxID=31354 RepID=A0A7S1TE17_9RHOD|mmetsp:Transcript_292/g.502  ORF Transcript_292/g.502 Transcript_292/m.502 type:complete len:116 (+) Transcript_292:301-648(+)